MKKLSIIVINYNSSLFTNKLIKSLNKIKDIIYEIIVIDNNSNDIKKLNQKQKLRLYKNDKNIGFSRAVNQAIKMTRSEFVLLLNPDTFLIDNSIKIILDTIIKNKKIGAIGGKIIRSENGNIAFTATSKPNFLTAIFEFTNFKKVFPNNYFSKKFWLESNKNIIKQAEVESLCGAFILFRKHLNEELNLFDERFFMYLEDIDFGMKINSLGYNVVFDPNVKIMHYGGGSTDSKYRTVLKYWYGSRKKFFKKHLSPISSSILNIIFSTEEFILSLYHKLKNTPNE